MNDGLLALAIAVPCWYGYKRSISRGRVEVNHVTTFTFGFLFYWVTPLAVKILASRLDFPMADKWSAFFRASSIVPYAVSCIALYLCFIFGDVIGAKLFCATELRYQARVPRLALSLTTAAACVLMVYSAYLERANLFRPVETTDIRTGIARGAVTACLVLIGTVALMFTIEHPESRWRQLLATRYFLPLLAGSALMIALGSRLYVASLLLMFLIYQTNFRRRFKLRSVIAVALLFAFLFGLVGTWREGSSPAGALFNVFLEPMEVSISLVHHLRYKGIAWINAPEQLMSDFRNLMPTVLVPDKYKLLKKPDAYRPTGGLHSFVSFNLNFGILGTAVFWFVWPMLFRYLRSRRTETLFATMYVMCSAWLAFTFFRDAFSISLVKMILEQSVLLPFAIVCFGRLLTAACAPAAESIRVSQPQPEGA